MSGWELDDVTISMDLGTIRREFESVGRCLNVPTKESLDSSLYPMLSGIDAFGNTLFNRRQMALLKAESIKHLEDYQEGSEAESLHEVIRLCELGMRVPHTFLWFLGN